MSIPHPIPDTISVNSALRDLILSSDLSTDTTRKYLSLLAEVSQLGNSILDYHEQHGIDCQLADMNISALISTLSQLNSLVPFVNKSLRKMRVEKFETHKAVSNIF